MKKRKSNAADPFEDFSVVKDAGYEKGKRRDKTINKRAGLHGRRKDEEKPIYRRKPLAVKHKRRLRKVIPLILATMAIVMVILITGSYKPPVKFEDLDGDYATVDYELPADGAPEEHTLIETVGYLNHIFKKQPHWSSEMDQDVTAMMGIKQGVHTYKMAYDGIVISADIGVGASVQARQFCVTDKVVLWRDAKDVTKTNGMNTEWNDGVPQGMSLGEFRKKRGLPPSELSVYVLNENTVYNAQDKAVVNNGDGTYSVTLELNVNTKSGEENNLRSAVYYYKQQMAMTGGLSQLPSYKYTNVTFTFDKDYRVLGCKIQDAYEATMRIPALGEVTSPCSSTTLITYDYNEETCKNSFYKDFFKQYENNFGAAAEPEQFAVTATNCLAGAFASVLTDGAVFNLNADLGGKPVDGVAAVALKDGGLDAVDVKLGNIIAHVLNGKEGYEMYLSLGGAKYRANLGNIALPAAAEEGGDDPLGGLLDTLMGGEFVYDSDTGVASLHSKLNLFGVDADLKFTFTVDEEAEEISLVDVKGDIKYKNIGLKATLSFGEEKDRPAPVTESEKSSYADVLNEGVEVGVNLTLGGKVINGVAKIDMADGQFAGVRAKLGGITVYYEDGLIYIIEGANKYKLDASAFGGASTLSLGGDMQGMLSGVLENLVIDNGEIKTSIDFDLFDKVNKLGVTVDLFDGIKVAGTLDMFGGIGVEATLGDGKNAPAKLTAADKEKFTDILNDGVEVGVNLTLGGKVINGVAKVDMADGEFAGVRAKLGEAEIRFINDALYLSFGNSKIKLPLSALAESGKGGGSFDMKSIIGLIVGNINIEDGIISASAAVNLWQEITVNASLDLFGGLKISADTELFGAKIAVNANLCQNAVIPAKLSDAEEREYVDVTEGFTLNGMIETSLAGQDIKLAVNNLALKLVPEISFKLDAVLLLNNTYNNFFVEYADGLLTITYGAVPFGLLDGGETDAKAITVQLDIGGGDIAALEDDIIKVYNGVAAVYAQIAKKDVRTAEKLSDVLGSLGLAKDGVKGMGEIMKMLAVPTDKDGNADIAGILSGLTLSSVSGGFAVQLGNIFAELTVGGDGLNCGANLKLGTSSFDFALCGMSVRNYTDIAIPCENPLQREGIAEMLDFLGAAADMLLQPSITVDVEGELYNTAEKYIPTGGLKYRFAALLEYDDGGNGFPVHYDDGKIYVDTASYLHFNLALAAQNTDDESVYLDAYVLDANANGISNGLTTGGYTPDKKSLDFYVSVSKYPDGTEGANPLKFYGTMDEVLGILSMGAAMLNLQDIDTDSDDVDKAVSAIYKLVDEMLLQTYIPDTKSQFASLGESLLPQILKTDLSSLLNSLIETFNEMKDDIENKTEITEGNFINKLTCADGRLDFELNTDNLLGVENYKNLSAYLVKTGGEKSLLSGVGINDIYFGENGENRMDIAAAVSYGGITKPDKTNGLKGYKAFTELDGLLSTAVNSATHETRDDEREAGYLADYKLNSNYCISGEVKLDILGSQIALAVNTLSVTIEEDNSVSFDVNLSYSKTKVILGIVSAIENDGVVDLSIRDGMVYMSKAVPGHPVIYRVMPADVFMSDMFNQLSFMLSFSSTINNLADQFMSGTAEQIFPVFNDFGDYIDKFLTLYEYSADAQEWTLKVNGDTLSGLAAMSGIGDITVKLKGADGNLKSLSLAGSLSIIKFDGNLTYLNPNEKFTEGAENKACNLTEKVADGLYYSWSEILGGGTFAEIDENLKWTELGGDTNKYLVYDGSAITLGGYTYYGASYKVNGGYSLGTLKELKERGVGGVKLEALWYRSELSLKADRSYNWDWNTTYNYTLGINSASISFVGNPEVIDGMSISGRAFGYINTGDGYEPNKEDDQHTAYRDVAISKDGNTFTVGAVDFETLKKKAKDYGHAAVDLSISCGGYTFNMSLHASKKF